MTPANRIERGQKFGLTRNRELAGSTGSFARSENGARLAGRFGIAVSWSCIACSSVGVSRPRLA
jgi:hypothetical protein